MAIKEKVKTGQYIVNEAYFLAYTTVNSVLTFFYWGYPMNQLVNSQNIKITTVELRGMVNAARKLAGESVVRNDQFVSRVLDELGEEIEGAKFLHLAPRTKTKMEAYRLTYKQALLVAMRESKAVRRSVVNRLEELERRLLAAEKAKFDRQYARLEAPEMTLALKEQREQEGKETPSYVYSNDFNMINRIVLGYSAAGYRKEHDLEKKEAIRDYLTDGQTEAVMKLQRLNTSLIELGMSYKERKQRLKDHFMQRFNDRIADEILQLEA